MLIPYNILRGHCPPALPSRSVLFPLNHSFIGSLISPPFQALIQTLRLLDIKGTDGQAKYIYKSQPRSGQLYAFF